MDFAINEHKVEELKNKYYKYDPKRHGFICGKYKEKDAWIINIDFDKDVLKILIGNYTEDDARKCLDNKSLYKGHIRNVSHYDWEEYNDWRNCCDYSDYDGCIELSDRRLFNEVSFCVSDDPKDWEDYNAVPCGMYDEYVESYSKAFSQIFWADLQFLGRSGRHVCISPDCWEDFVLVFEMAACVEELQDLMVEDIENMLQEYDTVRKYEK